MIKRLLGISLLSLSVSIAHAQESDEVKQLEREIELATEALEKAAQRLSELHVGNYMDKRKGHQRAMLGILLGPEPSIGGVPIVGTSPKGGAAQAGMVAGDLIVEIGGIDLRDSDDPLGELSTYMDGITPGETVALVVSREGGEQALDIVTRPKSAHIKAFLDGDELSSMIEQSLEDLDIDIEELTQKISLVKGSSSQIMYVDGDLAEYFDVDSGVIVIDAMDDSQLKNGDVFLTLGDTNVTDFEEVNEFLVELDDEIVAEIQRKGRSRDVVILPGEFTSNLEHEVQVFKKGGKKP